MKDEKKTADIIGGAVMCGCGVITIITNILCQGDLGIYVLGGLFAFAGTIWTMLGIFKD